MARPGCRAGRARRWRKTLSGSTSLARGFAASGAPLRKTAVIVAVKARELCRVGKGALFAPCPPRFREIKLVGSLRLAHPTGLPVGYNRAYAIRLASLRRLTNRREPCS